MRRTSWSVHHEQHGRVLALWYNGKTLQEIAAEMEMSRNLVSLIVCKARERGDPLAVHHTDKNGRIVGRQPERMRERRPRRAYSTFGQVSAAG